MPPSSVHRFPRPVFALAVVAAGLQLFASGCSWLPFSGGRGTTAITSLSQGTELRPRFTTVVHAARGEQIGDVYLTDLPVEVLTDPEAIAASTGQILHLHLFVRPRPGRTPIDPSAINTAVRYAVFAGGPAGLYAGGGFTLQSDAVTDDRFSGRLLDGSLRLSVANPGFADRLGTARLEVSYRARRDPELAAALEAALDRLAVTGEPPTIAAEPSQDEDPDQNPDENAGDRTDDASG